MSAIDHSNQRAPRLLVVNDEPTIIELLAASLRYAGFEVITATSGTEAVQAARQHHPDLVVLDVTLPDMDGFEVFRRLRAGGSRIPVIFLSARVTMEDKTRGLALGGEDYIPKTFSLEEVVARIRGALHLIRRRDRGPDPG